MQKWWSILFGVVMTAAGLSFVVAPLMGWWLPLNVSTFGPQVDQLFYLILGITGFFYVLTEALLVYNMYKFAGEEGKRGHYIHGNHTLEIVWTAVPAGILLLISILQISTWENIKYVSRMPNPDHVFFVSARQFEWRVRYPTPEQQGVMVGTWAKDNREPAAARSWSRSPHSDDVHVVNEVHTWKGSKVRLFLETKDVLHSFYLPNLRLKQDAVPGKIIPVWFSATEANTIRDEQTGLWVDGYDPNTKKRGQPDHSWALVCAELCGWGHYKMQGRLYVHETKEDYLAWLAWAQKEQNRSQPAETTTTAAR